MAETNSPKPIAKYRVDSPTNYRLAVAHALNASKPGGVNDANITYIYLLDSFFVITAQIAEPDSGAVEIGRTKPVGRTISRRNYSWPTWEFKALIKENRFKPKPKPKPKPKQKSKPGPFL